METGRGERQESPIRSVKRHRVIERSISGHSRGRSPRATKKASSTMRERVVACRWRLAFGVGDGVGGCGGEEKRTWGEQRTRRRETWFLVAHVSLPRILDLSLLLTVLRGRGHVVGYLGLLPPQQWYTAAILRR